MLIEEISCESTNINQGPSAERIAQRRADMPDVYRKNYDTAMTGNSRKAGVKAFCLECMMWQREEVRRCTSVACPLYPYRPFQDTENASERADLTTETENFDQGEE